MNRRYHVELTFITLALFFGHVSLAQFVTISGTIYDITAHRPLEAVTVLSTSGRGTISDTLGRYSLTMFSKDSIYFVFLNKSTLHFPVDTISNPGNFDVSIHVKAVDLPDVKVIGKSYRLDSLQNRRDYAKYFNYKKPGFALSSNPGYNPGGVTVGLDLDEFINMFRTRRNRNLEFLQSRLLEQEHDKYIDHRFSKLLVHKITKLNTPELDIFLVRYRPSYVLLETMNDLELGLYIEKCLLTFK